jgi:hypothetical protein
VHAGVGAPVADVACTGTALRDFNRMTDGASFTEDEVTPYDSDSAAYEASRSSSPSTDPIVVRSRSVEHGTLADPPVTLPTVSSRYRGGPDE